MRIARALRDEYVLPGPDDRGDASHHAGAATPGGATAGSTAAGAVPPRARPPATAFPHVQAHDLRVLAGDRMAVDGLHLTLGAGVHGLLGPNGAGKTTLIRALATAAMPAGGSLRLLGEPVRAGGDLRAMRRRIGYLPQKFGYFARFTVREFVEYLAWQKEVPDTDIATAAAEAIAKVGLSDRAGHKLKKLSGGMLRRVGIAQAIVNRPALLLLDEPTVGLDPEQRLQFRELLRGIGADACVVVSTHLVADVAVACTDVTVLADGRLVFTGPVDELRQAGEAGEASEAGEARETGETGRLGEPGRGGEVGGAGDSPWERGYAAVLRTYRGQDGSTL
jgi:ABC-2 type transport system ATP-binding protein